MPEELTKSPRIRLHFNVHEPVELVELTLAFQGLGYEYQSYLKEQAVESLNQRNIKDVKLYITRIESNCILAELAPAIHNLGVLATAFGDINNIVSFIKATSGAIAWLQNVSSKKDLSADEVPYSKRKIRNIKNILNLVSKNKNSNLGLHAIRYEESSGNDHTILSIDFNDKECEEAEKGAENALLALDGGEQADYEKVLMYFYQTNIDDPKSTGQTGDKAIITSISDSPKRVYIISTVDQEKIRFVLDDREHNPLQTGFVVDVNIEKDPKGRPRVYRVLRLHDVIYDED